MDACASIKDLLMCVCRQTHYRNMSHLNQDFCGTDSHREVLDVAIRQSVYRPDIFRTNTSKRVKYKRAHISGKTPMILRSTVPRAKEPLT